MKWVTGVILVVLVGLGWGRGATVFAAEPGLIIIGLQTGSAISASEEYIELANTSTDSIDVDAVRLEYFAAAPKSFTVPSRTIKLQGSVASGAHYLLTATNYRTGEGNQTYSPTLAAAGGHLRLMNGTAELDFVGWGTATGAHGQPAPAPPAGQPLLRLQTLAGYSQSGDNSVDFGLQDQVATAEAGGQLSASLELSELLPDPVAPATDATGEYIEIHNTGSSSLSLAGYSIKVGTTAPKSFNLPAQNLAADGYLAFYAPASKLTLSNTGSKVQLLTGAEVLDETTYPKAVAGSAWAWDGVAWTWTAKPTPNQANHIEAIVAGIPTKPLATAKKAAAKKTATKKSTATKSTKKKSTKKTAVAGASTNDGVVAAEAAATNQPAKLHNGVLAGVGSLAVLYGAYEYRQDLANTFQKLRRNRRDRS